MRTALAVSESQMVVALADSYGRERGGKFDSLDRPRLPCPAFRPIARAGKSTGRASVTARALDVETVSEICLRYKIVAKGDSQCDPAEPIRMFREEFS